MVFGISSFVRSRCYTDNAEFQWRFDRGENVYFLGYPGWFWTVSFFREWEAVFINASKASVRLFLSLFLVFSQIFHGNYLHVLCQLFAVGFWIKKGIKSFVIENAKDARLGKD